MSDPDELDRYRAPALDKGLDILELLAGEEEGLSQAEIAKALGRTPNEQYRMLERLVRRGYVARSASDRYELTLKLFGLAHFHRPIRRLVSLATPMMRALAARSMQSNHLAVYDRAGVTVIAQMDAPGYWGLAIRVGARVDLFNTGSGHVLMAFQSPDEREMMIEEQENAGEEGGRPEDLEERLTQIRARRLRGDAEPAERRRLQPFGADSRRRRGGGGGADLSLYCAAQPTQGPRHSGDDRDAMRGRRGLVGSSRRTAGAGFARRRRRRIISI